MNIKKYDILTKVTLKSYVYISLIFFAGCSSSFNKDESSNVVAINVLDPDYFADCHIPGSINIPFEQFEDRIKTFDKKKHYVVYCSNYACTAAPFAASMLKDAGFENVSFLPGGIVDWHQKGYPCTGSCTKHYLKDNNEPLTDEDHWGVRSVSNEELKVFLKL